MATTTVSATHELVELPGLGKICLSCAVTQPGHFSGDDHKLAESCEPKRGMVSPSGEVASLEEEALFLEQFREPFHDLHQGDEYHDARCGPQVYGALRDFAQRFIMSIAPPGVTYHREAAARLSAGDIILDTTKFFTVARTGYIHDEEPRPTADYSIWYEGDNPDFPHGSGATRWPISLVIVRKGPPPLAA